MTGELEWARGWGKIATDARPTRRFVIPAQAGIHDQAIRSPKLKDRHPRAVGDPL